MRNRILVSVHEELKPALLPTLQTYAVTQLVRDPVQRLKRLDPARTAALVLSDDVASSLPGLVGRLRDARPLLPVLCLVGRPTRELLWALAQADVECQLTPVAPPALHRFAQRALGFGALPDEAVATWVGRLARTRRLAPRETQLLCMALADESRACMRRTLGVSENTLKGYVRDLLRKTGERSLDRLAKNVLRVALLEARPGTRDIYRAPWLASTAAA